MKVPQKTFAGLLILHGIFLPMQAQKILYASPNWWFGLVEGLNINNYSGRTQVLNATTTATDAFQNGVGKGLYGGIVVEYRIPNSTFGMILQAGLDGRNGAFEQLVSPSNNASKLVASLQYLTFEPSLSYSPFRHANLFLGPRLAFNSKKRFTYQKESTSIKSDFSYINSTLISIQVGANYDIPITTIQKRKQMVIAPFISYQPPFGQKPRSIESWNVSTVRMGIVLKVGYGRRLSAMDTNSPSYHTVDSKSELDFKNYLELKARGMYEESDKWMIKFAERKPNDLRALDYQAHRSELKSLLLDNGNYTITPVKYMQSLNIKSYKIPDGIGENKKLSTLLKHYSAKHPCLSADGKNIYFDSDMAGGFGQKDIYRMTKNDEGSWGKPQNLGEKINTEADESFPYYKQEGQILFFSSNGRYGLGGLDIFIYAINFSGFGRVYNAGFPLNSRYDDYAITMTDSLNQGFFKSNRKKGKGSGAIYSVTFH